MKHELSATGCRVDILLKGFEAYSPVMKLSYGVNQVSERAAKMI
jgi:hypothetical protein